MRALGEPGCHERKGLAWLGIPGGNYAAAVRFFGETLSLDGAFDAGNTVELAAGNGDRIQLFGSGHRYFEFYRSYGARIVPLLEVDDLDQASAELARGGAEVLGGPESDGTWTWLTFRMPDGNIHSLGARMA
jgi:predicted enzyme related to lactoylglutathione lyase